MDKLKLVLDTQLKDDNSELGGVSYSGETLNDFLLECDIEIPDDYTDGWMKKSTLF